jgi:SAM-dependent methyltransferase
MPEAVACNLCGGDDAKLLYRLRDYRLLVDDIDWNVVRCRSCGLGYLNPRPTREEIGRYYPDSYYGHRKAHGGRYRRLAAYVPPMGSRLLDVGTAGGEFLVVMRERGWEVEGIEPFGQADDAHGLPIHRMSFPEECTLPPQSYDVITAWAVFEHLHDPVRAFEACAGLLRPGGHLVIQVPNLRSIFSRWARQEDVPRHLHFFSPTSLRDYAARCGLELERVVHTTDLFGGSGRGVLRLALLRALGRTTPEFFEVMRTPLRERFHRWPLLMPGWLAVSALEHVVLSDRLVRAARISGQIVVTFRRPVAPGFRSW